MPPFSTLKTYVKAVNSGNTNITRVLTTLMQDPEQWAGEDLTVDPGLSAFLRGEFGAPGRMTETEVQHIEIEWPTAQKEALRLVAVDAIEEGRPMVFKWGLTSGSDPVTDIVEPPAGAPLTVPILVTFRSPKSGVTFSDELPESSSGYVTIDA